MIINYQKVLDKAIENISKNGEVPTLLLHSCCAPCSSYVLEYLSKYFKITVFYYNPNIYPEEEYHKRVIEQKQFVEKFSFENPVSFLAATIYKLNHPNGMHKILRLIRITSYNVCYTKLLRNLQK